jgi:hypothetical protein
VVLFGITLAAADTGRISDSHPASFAAIEVSEPDLDRSIAILPLTNRSGSSVPLAEIQHSLTRKLENHRGISILDEEVLGRFMRRHRMRYTSGLSTEMARLLETETGARAALITSVDLYQESFPPRFALTSRLVSTGDAPRILWMGSAVLAGDEAPGIVDTGLIVDIDVICGEVISDIAESVPRPESISAPGETELFGRKSTRGGRFRPKIFYSSSDFPVMRDRAGRIVVLPFSNESTTRYAGEILTDQLIRHLVEAGADVIEPGVARQALLRARQIYVDGPSVPETDILRLILESDVILFGEVIRYQEAGPLGPPFVDFSLRAIDASTRQVIWSSISYSRGNQGVFFFDLGRVHTAHELASKMTRALVATVRRKGRKSAARQR